MVSLAAEDEYQNQGSDSKTIVVTNVSPTISLSAVPEYSLEGTTIDVTASATDPGVADTLTYVWRLLVGETEVDSGSGASFSFAPPDDGPYTLSLEVSDDDETTSINTTFFVGDVAPQLTLSAAATVDEGQSWTLDVSATDPGDDNSPSWVVDWGDGSAWEPISGSSGSHVFAQGNQTHLVTVTATNEDGAFTATTQVQIFVAGPPVAPDHLQALGLSTNSVVLTWEDKSTTEANYRIYQDASLLVVLPADTTQYRVNGLSPATSYSFTVKAVNAHGESASDGPLGIQTPAPAVTFMDARPVSGTSAMLSWEYPVPEVPTGGYTIQWSTDGTSFEPVNGIPVAGTASAHLVENLDPLTTYLFRIVATLNGVTSAPAYASAYLPLAAPTALTASPGESTITLNWTYASAGHDGFAIMRSIDGAPFVTIASSLAPDALSWPDTGLTARSQYAYRIVATTSGGTSQPSNTAKARPTAFPTVPISPTATATARGTVEVAWTNGPASHENGFEIYYSPNQRLTWIYAGSAPAGATSFTVEHLADGMTYDFRIDAVNANARPGVEFGTATTMVPAPTDLAAETLNATDIRLTWADQSEGESGFVVEVYDQVQQEWTTHATIERPNATSYVYRWSPSLGEPQQVFRVRAHRGGVTSAPSNEVEAAAQPWDSPGYYQVFVVDPIGSTRFPYDFEFTGGLTSTTEFLYAATPLDAVRRAVSGHITVPEYNRTCSYPDAGGEFSIREISNHQTEYWAKFWLEVDEPGDGGMWGMWWHLYIKRMGITIEVPDDSLDEASGDQGAVTFRVVSYGGGSSPTSEDPVVVRYALSGTATAGTDYEALPGVVTIPAGQNSVTVGLSPLNDDTLEPDEYAWVSLLGSADYFVEAGQAGCVSLTITSDDVPDLDIDSDNNDGLNDPERSPEEDEIEADRPGKLVLLNVGDADGDGILDRDDIGGLNGDAAGEQGAPFVPVILELSPGLDPWSTVLQLDSWWADARLWTKDGDELRLWTDELPQYIRLGDLPSSSAVDDHTWRFYLEGLSSWGMPSKLTARVFFSDLSFVPDLYDDVDFTVSGLDADIDSDNTDIGSPERSGFEESIEDDPARPGKVIVIQDIDRDSDGIVDVLDNHINLGTGAPDLGIFAPMVLSFSFSDAQTAGFRFVYDQSTPPSGTADVLPPGHLRLWLKDGDQDRDPDDLAADGDFLASNTFYTAETLGLHDGSTALTLYVEAVRTSNLATERSIKVEFFPLGTAEPEPVRFEDKVMVTAVTATPMYYGDASNTVGGYLPQAVGGDPAALATDGVVRYFDGTISLPTVDLASGGFGGWQHARTFTNRPGFGIRGINGNGWVVSELPSVVRSGDTAIVISGGNARFYDWNGTSWKARFFTLDGLGGDPMVWADATVLTDTAGNVTEFWSYESTVPLRQRGQFKRFTDAAGNTTTAVYDGDGFLREVRQAPEEDGSEQRFSYEYYTQQENPDNGDLLKSVTLERRSINQTSAWDIIRGVTYEYYTKADGEAAAADYKGGQGDLKLVTVADSAGVAIARTHFRYHKPAADGGPRQLKAVLGPTNYARMRQDKGDPTNASESEGDLQLYADYWFTYDAEGRVQTQTVQGAGPTRQVGTAMNATGTFSYSYAANPATKIGRNVWVYKTVESQLGLDGSTVLAQHVVYSNHAGQAMLESMRQSEGSAKWPTFYEYDSEGRLLFTAMTSAVSDYAESLDDLVGKSGSIYTHLRPADGLISGTAYAGGYVIERYVQRGYGTTPVPVQAFTYDVHGGLVYVASDTVYSGGGGTGASTTSFTYTWHNNQPASITTTLPVVSPSQNGPGGTGATIHVSFDRYGRPLWSKDADGFLAYSAYDRATGAVVRQIVDVNTSSGSDFASLPFGWGTPAAGGLHLKTDTLVDSLGRPTQLTDPHDKVSYFTYGASSDSLRESRIYSPTGVPVTIMQEDWAQGFVQTLTMEAPGTHTGSEPLTNVKSLSRAYLDSAGRIYWSDRYWNLAGLSNYSEKNLGQVKTHYYRTEYGFDQAGRPDRVRNAVGTVTRIVYDWLGRQESVWVGINDQPISGAWSPTSQLNLVKVRQNEYDGGSAHTGDGNLTRVTLRPSGRDTPLPNDERHRVTQMWYDWRNRLVATKQGVEATEDERTNRPITLVELDNLGRTTAISIYDGDTVVVGDADSDGVPDIDGENQYRLRARTENQYDDRSRIYQTTVLNVDQQYGLSSGGLVTSFWYDNRSNLIKTKQPGGLVSKSQFDGASRLVRQYTSDEGGDTTWVDAGNVIGDAVLEQTNVEYDRNSNVVLVTTKQRFHNATGTGALQGPTAAPQARITYVGNWYDDANRLRKTVDFGTYGGKAPERDAEGRVLEKSRVAADGFDQYLVTEFTHNVAGQIEIITDPRGVSTKREYDVAGRLAKEIEAYTNSAPTDYNDRTTVFTYTGLDQPETVTKMAGLHPQTTTYLYGVWCGDGSGLDSNDVLGSVKYNKYGTISGLTKQREYAAYSENFTYNALGEMAFERERTSVLHAYARDVVGRLRSDTVSFSAQANGMDAATKQRAFEYDVLGRGTLFSTKNQPSPFHEPDPPGTVTSQVRRDYDGLGNLVSEWQDHAHEVITAGDTPSARVRYDYASGTQWLDKMIYPDGRELRYGYDGSPLDTAIGRVSYIADLAGTTAGQHLEEYSYLGLDTVVERRRPMQGGYSLSLSHVGASGSDGGDQYGGLDRFGRVLDQVWVQNRPDTNTWAQDNFRYAYDASGNMLYKQNRSDPRRSELYQYNGMAANVAYDAFGQMKEFRRGILGSQTPGSRLNLISAGKSTLASQNWGHDADGNYKRGISTPADVPSIRPVFQSPVPPPQDPTDPPEGNQLYITFDAWGQLRAFSVTYAELDPISHQLVYVVKEGSTCRYDALGRRISENSSDLYYDQSGQVIHEGPKDAPSAQYIWSSADGLLVLRDRNATPGGGSLGRTNSGLDERLYAMTDAAGNVTGITDATGQAVERYLYTPEGRMEVKTGQWGDLPPGPSAYEWRYTFRGGRKDAQGLYWINGQEWDYMTGGVLKEDPVAYADARNSYSEWRARNSDVSIDTADPYYLARIGRVSGWVSTAAFTLASFGMYTAALGLARGAMTFAGMALAGGTAGGTYAYARGGNVGQSAFVGAEIATALGTFSPRLSAMAVAGAGRAGLRAAAAGRTFAGGFARGIAEPAGIYMGSFGGQGLGGAVRVVRGMRAGFAELKGLVSVPRTFRVRSVNSTGGGLRRVTQYYDPAKGTFPIEGRYALSSEATLGNRIVDRITSQTTWVAPRAASEMTWWRRLMTGVGNRRSYVEFDALPGELQAPGGLKSVFGSYQQVIPGRVDLLTRNPVYGTSSFNFLDAGVRYMALPAGAAGGGYLVYSVVTDEQ